MWGYNYRVFAPHERNNNVNRLRNTKVFVPVEPIVFLGVGYRPPTLAHTPRADGVLDADCAIAERGWLGDFRLPVNGSACRARFRRRVIATPMTCMHRCFSFF